jgi:DNA-binding CsgD family transcriptional regulator
MTRPSPVLVGRKAARRRLRDALESAAGGTAQAVVLRGHAGVGKTALLDDLAATAEATHAARVLTISGHPAEQQLPYAGIHQLLHAAGDGDAHRFDGVDPLREATAVREMIAGASGDATLVVIVDDAQWLDAASRRALVFAARRLASERVLIALSTQADAEEWRIGSTMDVEPLGPSESLDVLSPRYPDLSARVAARVVERAAGLPRALLEIPAELGAVQREGGAPLPSILPLGPTLTGLFADRIGGLSDPSRRALLAASFEPLDADELSTALATWHGTIDDLDDAERAGLVRVVDGVCRFAHPAVPAAMQSLARSRELSTAHRALATVFASDPLRAAPHVLQLRDDPSAALEIVCDAARAATAGGDHAEAVSLWIAAAGLSHRLGRTGDEHEQRRAAFAACLRAGMAPEARVIAEQLLRDTADSAARARLLRDLVSLAMWTTSAPPDDDAWFEEQSLRLRDDDDPAVRSAGLGLLTILATAAFSGGRFTKAHRLGRHLTSGRAEPDLEHRLLDDATAVMAGEPGSGQVLRSEWTDAYDWTRILDPSTPAGHITVVLGWLGELELLASAIAHARGAIDRSGTTTAGLYVLSSMTVSYDRYRGRWDEALAGFDALERLGADTDFTAPYPFFALRQAHLLAARGDRAACDAVRRRARERAPAWTPAMEHLDRCVAGLLALAHREFEPTLDALTAAGRIERDSGLVISGYLSRVPDAFEAAWRLGREHELADELQRFDDTMRAVGHTELIALAERCRALLAPPGALDEMFERALAALPDTTDGFEAARTRLLWGERLRRARRRADARVQFALAQQVFLRLGAATWSDRCESELAACGVRRTAPVTAAGAAAEALTPREREVALTVAAGTTNAEAAQRLFISERTAEFHLHNVYRKLGLHNRRDLAAALAAQADRPVDPPRPAQGELSFPKNSEARNG